MNRTHVPLRRAIGAAVAAVLLMAAVPQSALADSDNLWKRWATSVTLTDRTVKAEIPFAIAFSFIAMVVTTPFWLLTEGLDKISEMRRADDEADE